LKKEKAFKLLSKEDNSPATTRIKSNFLEVGKEKHDPFSVTSTKKATVDDNEPGKQASLQERIDDLDRIKHIKKNNKISTQEEEEKKMTQDLLKGSLLYNCSHIDEEEDKPKIDREKNEESSYFKYIVGALTLGTIGLILWKKSQN
jgi:hypothetical protein